MRSTMLSVLRTALFALFALYALLAILVPWLAPGAARAQTEGSAAAEVATGPEATPDATEEAATESLPPPTPVAAPNAEAEAAEAAALASPIAPTLPTEPVEVTAATLPSPPDPTVDRAFEMFWAASGIVALSLSPALSTHVDFAFAVDRQWLVGPELSVSYAQSTSMGFPDPVVDLTTTVMPGLFLQHYFTPPATGGVMPTLRVGLGLTYAERSSTMATLRSADVALGANASVSGGVTWLPEPWLGVRVIGGANASFSVTVEGVPEQVLWGLGVFAEAGVVVRI